MFYNSITASALSRTKRPLHAAICFLFFFAVVFQLYVLCGFVAFFSFAST